MHFLCRFRQNILIFGVGIVVILQRDSKSLRREGDLLLNVSPLSQPCLAIFQRPFNNGCSHSHESAVVPQWQSRIVKAGLERHTFSFFFIIFVFPGTFRNRGKAIQSSFLKTRMLRQLLVKLRSLAYVFGWTVSSRSDGADRKRARWVAEDSLAPGRGGSSPGGCWKSNNPARLRISLLTLFRLSYTVSLKMVTLAYISLAQVPNFDSCLLAVSSLNFDYFWHRACVQSLTH